MKSPWRIEMIRLQTGENYPLLINRNDGLPLFDPTVYATSMVRNKGLAESTTKSNLRAIMFSFGWGAIPERAFLDGITITGEMPKAIFTIENRGAYVDFPGINTDILLIHAPGDDTALAIKLLNLLPANLPCYHFGDIDPKGLKIANSLRRKVPQKMQLFLPGFWVDYVNETFTGRKHWPENDIVDLSSDIIRTLRKEKKWLEQERIILDPRLQVEIRKLITTTP